MMIYSVISFDSKPTAKVLKSFSEFDDAKMYLDKKVKDVIAAFGLKHTSGFNRKINMEWGWAEKPSEVGGKIIFENYRAPDNTWYLRYISNGYKQVYMICGNEFINY